MVVEDFNLVRPLFRPAEAQAVLLVDADAELALPVASEGFQTIAGRAFEVVEIGCSMQHEQLGPRPAAQIRGKMPGRQPVEQFLRFLACEAANHAGITYTRNRTPARENVPDCGKHTADF
jgi:hypothetical protein